MFYFKKALSIRMRPTSRRWLRSFCLEAADSNFRIPCRSFSIAAMAKDLAIILNSGSVNSAVVTAMAMQRYRPIFVHLANDPQSGSRWQAAYEQQVSHFKPYREHTLVMPAIAPSTSGAAAASIAVDPRAKGHLAPQLIELLPLLSVVCASRPTTRRRPSISDCSRHADRRPGDGYGIRAGMERVAAASLRPGGVGADGAAVGNGGLAGDRSGVSDLRSSGENLELRRRKLRAVLGLPRLPCSRSRVSAGGQTGCVAWGEEDLNTEPLTAAASAATLSECSAGHRDTNHPTRASSSSLRRSVAGRRPGLLSLDSRRRCSQGIGLLHDQRTHRLLLRSIRGNHFLGKCRGVCVLLALE